MYTLYVFDSMFISIFHDDEFVIDFKVNNETVNDFLASKYSLIKTNNILSIDLP